MIFLNEEINTMQSQEIRTIMKQLQQMTYTEQSEKANIDTIIHLLKGFWSLLNKKKRNTSIQKAE